MNPGQTAPRTCSHIWYILFAILAFKGYTQLSEQMTIVVNGRKGLKA